MPQTLKQRQEAAQTKAAVRVKRKYRRRRVAKRPHRKAALQRAVRGLVTIESAIKKLEAAREIAFREIAAAIRTCL